MNVLLVALGGALGSGLRFVMSGWVQRSLPAVLFPYGTLAVNVSGCLLIGLLNGLADSRGLLAPATRLFILVGLLGGFTTFSTFAFETLALGRDAEPFRALANVTAHVVLGLSAVWLGHYLGRIA